jgi:hypothetical protein
VSRLKREDRILRLSPGLYRLAGAPTEAHHALAEASKPVPATPSA